MAVIDPKDLPAVGSVWRHTRRGTTYTVLAIAIGQDDGNSQEFGIEDDPCVVYQGEDGQVWVRLAQEFLDQRAWWGKGEPMPRFEQVLP